MPLDAGEFDALFREFYPRLCLFIVRIVGHDAVVEDIATDAFVALWERRDLVRGQDDAKKVLYRVSRNAALNALRNERSHDRITRGALHEITSVTHGTRLGMDPDRDVRNADVDRAVRDAIAALPLVRRQVYTLRWEQGLRSAEIAELLDLSLKTVEMHVTLAHKALRSALSAFGPVSDR